MILRVCIEVLVPCARTLYVAWTLFIRQVAVISLLLVTCLACLSRVDYALLLLELMPFCGPPLGSEQESV